MNFSKKKVRRSSKYSSVCAHSKKTAAETKTKENEKNMKSWKSQSICAACSFVYEFSHTNIHCVALQRRRRTETYLIEHLNCARTHCSTVFFVVADEWVFSGISSFLIPLHRNGIPNAINKQHERESNTATFAGNSFKWWFAEIFLFKQPIESCTQSITAINAI